MTNTHFGFESLQILGEVKAPESDANVKPKPRKHAWMIGHYATAGWQKPAVIDV